MPCFALASTLKEKIEFTELQDEWPHIFKDKTPDTPITFDIVKESIHIENRKQLETGISLAFQVWEAEIPLPIRKSKHNEVPDIVISFDKDDQYFKDRPATLAYAYFPATSKQGIVVFNDNYVWTLDGRSLPHPTFPNSKIKTWNVVHVAIHEFGHTLGLNHSTDENSDDVMDPFYDGQLELSDYDIQRIIAKYGPRLWLEKQYIRFKAFLKHRLRRW